MDEELGTLLVLVYLAESNNPQPVPLVPLQPPFVKFFVGDLPPTVGLIWLASALVIESPTSNTICVSSQVCDNPGNLPTTSSPSNCLSLLLISSGEEVWPLRVPLAGDSSSFLPSASFPFLPSEME